MIETSASQQDLHAGSAPHVIDAKYEAHRLYHIIGDDDSVVERTAREVADGSKLLSNVALWKANFQATLLKVRAWCEARTDVLRAALVDIRSNKVLFYFIPTGDRYDLTLGAAMTELEVELGSAGLGYVEGLQVPARSIERFAGPKSLILWQREGEMLFAPATEPSMPGTSVK
jgi:hypothetical protein